VTTVHAISPKASRVLWSIVSLFVFIAVAVVIRRMVALAAGPGANDKLGLDTHFAQHTALTLAHIIPALVFIILAPLQFIGRVRTRAPRFHRWLGRLLVGLGLVIGIPALPMTFMMNVGGVSETAAIVLFDTRFLFFLAKGYVAVRRRDYLRHREWMIRMFSIALGVAAVRPVMGIFFATRELSHLTPHDFFGTAFWIGFTLSLIAGESWINYTRQLRTRPPSPLSRPAHSKETSSSAPVASAFCDKPVSRQ
jgi:uncharacterized membrane protein